ncbi:TOMM precursor leader peptide-binding protein [Bacillus atrophaeus]|uniref:TOMM precursor leader peptide-binding protein n=1 Tax=Bacillus atrophaeus TaxID=1452 RepID=UPI0022817AE4|nr:TOMM precursor leader peptide-binding protein [Bacillus atrophaeus]MCY8499912.1 TOMM precursor leader peptide-binding protein [Bacillus atrophaeus]MCY8812440.1 TOMM precursor leader peptide-binding protein [Bacillus atrophaeus]MCY8822392.1 TOMM precursor leader peptide-binding protein [Bacillus atrophaeus]MCY8829238.1 TOMM precursor leader peptide-binding protein [Bacillus atrophaeus]MCY8832912.1 TOMM precursor leader peptide-binding protein [Bacillus atrophaeus]
MEKSVLIIGKGYLAENAQSILLKNNLKVTRVDNIMKAFQYIEETSIVLSCSDNKTIKKELEIQKFALERNIPFLRACIDVSKIFIGPWVVPDSNSGCINCCEKRSITAHPNKEILKQKTDDYFIFGNIEDVIEKTSILFYISMIYNQIIYYIKGNRTELFSEKVYIGDLITLKGRTHSFQPNPLCRICSILPEDSSSFAMINFKDHFSWDKDKFRINNTLSRKTLRKHYLDYQTGLVTHIFRNQTKIRWMPFVVAEMPLFEGEEKEYGSGRTYNFYDSENSSILEALERYVGMHPRRTKTKIRGSYNHLKEIAVDPKRLTLHDKNQYKEPGYKFEHYTDDLEFNWCWAYSWKEKQSKLLPETMIYYRLLNQKEQEHNRFVYETSNGCALGSSIEEAIFYGLLEIIERDAFLVAWYTQRPLTRIGLENAKDKNLLIIKDLIEAQGYELYIFDTTMETGIPSVWVLIVNPDNNAPVKTYSAAGAHPNPEKAILSALVEVSTSFAIYEEEFIKQRDKATEMVQDSGKVQVMNDHVLLYSHPAAYERLSFLFSKEKVEDIDKCYKSWYESEPDDNFTNEVVKLMNKIKGIFGDIFIVNQTSLELDELNLNGVKVLVEGMLTMSFGHQYRRINLKRLRDAVKFLETNMTIKSEKDVNPYPHPFP